MDCVGGGLQMVQLYLLGVILLLLLLLLVGQIPLLQVPLDPCAAGGPISITAPQNSGRRPKRLTCVTSGPLLTMCLRCCVPSASATISTLSRSQTVTRPNAQLVGSSDRLGMRQVSTY